MNVPQLESAKKYILYLKRFLPKFKERTSKWYKKVLESTAASRDLANTVFEYSLNTTAGMKGALTAYGNHLYQSNDVLIQGLDYLRAFSKRIYSCILIVSDCEEQVEKCLKYVRATNNPQMPTQQTGPVGQGSPIPTFITTFNTLQSTLRTSLQVFLTAHARVSMVSACSMVQGANDLGKAVLLIDELDSTNTSPNLLGMETSGTNIIGHTVDIRGVPSVEIQESHRVLRTGDMGGMSNMSTMGYDTSMNMNTSMGMGYNTGTPRMTSMSGGGDFSFANPNMTQENSSRSSSKKRSRSIGNLFHRKKHKDKNKDKENPQTATSPGNGMSMDMSYGVNGGGYMQGGAGMSFNANVGAQGQTIYNPNINTNFSSQVASNEDYGFEGDS